MGVGTSAKPNKRSYPDHIDVLRHVNECISLTRVSDAVLVFTNAYFERMFGYGPDELLGQHVSILNSPDVTDPIGVAAEIISELRADGRWRALQSPQERLDLLEPRQHLHVRSPRVRACLDHRAT